MRSSGGRSKDSVQERLGVGTARATLALTHRRATQSRASCGAPARARRGKRMGRAQQQRPLQPQRRRQQQHRRQKQPHQDQCPQTDIRIFVPAVATQARTPHKHPQHTECTQRSKNGDVNHNGHRHTRDGTPTTHRELFIPAVAPRKHLNHHFFIPAACYVINCWVST